MSENLKRAELLFNRIINNSYVPPKPRQRRPEKDFDLPKRDPVREAQQAVTQVPPEHHVLFYCWTVWHHARGKQKPEDDAPVNAVSQYMQRTHEIEFSSVAGGGRTKRIASVEQMWAALCELKRSSDLASGTELLVFKTGVHPIWEDPLNLQGGRWVFRFLRRHLGPGSPEELQESVRQARRRTTLVWERLVVRTLTGTLLQDNAASRALQEAVLGDLVGLVLSVRRDEDIVLVWNLNGLRERKGAPSRRVLCDAVLRVVRECDLILQGSDCVLTQVRGLTERVPGLLFEYRLHTDNTPFRRRHLEDGDERAERAERAERSEGPSEPSGKEAGAR